MATEVADLIRHVKATGTYDVAVNGGTHYYKVVDANGKQVVDDDGPVTLPSTPSDRRSRENNVKRLIRAGVLDHDPFKAGGQKGEKSPRRILDPEGEARRIAALHERSRRFNERTLAVKARLDPTIAKLGGWSQGATGVTLSEVALVVFEWARSRDLAVLPKGTKFGYQPITANHVVGPVKAIKNGHTIGDKWLPLMESFVDELDAHEDGAARYRQLLREAKGLPSALSPLPPEVMVDADEPVYAKVGPLYGDDGRTLAMRALWYMARGAAPEDREAVFAIVDEIDRLST